MSTARQDQSFAAMINDHVEVTTTVSKSALEFAIEWISNEFEPDDLFTEKQLSSWAESNGYVKE
jgi:hypothetical protein